MYKLIVFKCFSSDIRAGSSRRCGDKVSVSPYPHPVLVCDPARFGVKWPCGHINLYNNTQPLPTLPTQGDKEGWKVKERELPVIEGLQLYESGGWGSGGVRKQREVREQY